MRFLPFYRLTLSTVATTGLTNTTAGIAEGDVTVWQSCIGSGDTTCTTVRRRVLVHKMRARELSLCPTVEGRDTTWGGNTCNVGFRSLSSPFKSWRTVAQAFYFWNSCASYAYAANQLQKPQNPRYHKTVHFKIHGRLAFALHAGIMVTGPTCI